MEIIGNIKNYDWGKLGSSSEVAKLALLNSSKFQVDEQTPYSELWMGDHPSGPSIIKSNEKELSTVLKEKLPFLFKVLSIRKALSIQVHPNKSEAERLHKERPDVYKDPNHKPELAIALTPFLALCGFRPYEEIANFCAALPPLKTLLGDKVNIEELRCGSSAALKQTYEALMTSSESDTAKCIENIVQNYGEVLQTCNLLETFCTINCDFPNDVGVLSLFFLNLIHLQPGQAIFLAANEIHAYLSGDCVECMACSDNVIRAGLTPKYKDVQQLISCLNYTGSPPAKQIFQPHVIDANVQIFIPPVDDFAVLKVVLTADKKEYKLQIQAFSAILLVLEGERLLRINGKQELLLKRGSIVYIPPEAAPEIEFISCDTACVDFIGYMSMCNYFKN